MIGGGVEAGFVRYGGDAVWMEAWKQWRATPGENDNYVYAIAL